MHGISSFTQNKFNFLSEKKYFDSSFHIKSMPIKSSKTYGVDSVLFKKCCVDCTPNSSVSC